MGANPRRALGVVLAAAAGVVVWLIVKNVFDVAFDIQTGADTQPMNVVVIALGATIVTGLGWAVAALLVQFAPRPRLTWVLLAVLVYALWFTAPFTQAVNITSGERVAILTVHTVVAAVFIAAVAPTLPDRRVRASNDLGEDFV